MSFLGAWQADVGIRLYGVIVGANDHIGPERSGIDPLGGGWDSANPRADVGIRPYGGGRDEFPNTVASHQKRASS